MKFPTPLDSKKVWITALTQAAIVAVAFMGRADGPTLSAIIAVGGVTGAATGLIDYTNAKKAGQ